MSGGCHAHEEVVAGGIGTLAPSKPIRIVARYWPYAPTPFDDIRRAMPLTAPQSLTNGDVHVFSACLLSVDPIVPAGIRMDAASLPRVRMPNRHGFASPESSGFDGDIDRASHLKEK